MSRASSSAPKAIRRQRRYNGKPAAGLAHQPCDRRQRDRHGRSACRRRSTELEPTFPPGVEVVYPYDTTPFVELSIEEVVKTLIEAIVLVFLVMFVFLQNLRATLIPTIAVPVVLLGTFGVLAVFGYSINTLTMFAMVLAIGLLVDDAIVVVENVERVMQEEEPVAEGGDAQIDGARSPARWSASPLVLSAVFVPMAFFGGSTGVIYRQFSITIVSAMVLSVLVALVLTPALCATILKPAPSDGMRRSAASSAGSTASSTAARRLSRRRRAACIKRAGALHARLPRRSSSPWAVCSCGCRARFLPEEDQGILITSVHAAGRRDAGAHAERC